MKANEIKAYVDQVAHECSNYSYFACLGEDEPRFKAMYTVDYLIMLANILNLDLKVVNDEYCRYAVVYAPIGKNKMYFRWVTSCDRDVDTSTYTEFKKVVTNYMNEDYDCYVTDGGMSKVNSVYDL